jgi:hypothetical protein
MRAARSRGLPALETPCSRSIWPLCQGVGAKPACRELASVVVVAEQALRPEDGGELGAYALQLQEQAGRRFGMDLLLGEQSIPLGLHRLELLEQQLETVQLAGDLRLQVRRQLAAVARAQRRKPRPSVPAQRLILADPLREQQPLDPVALADSPRL